MPRHLLVCSGGGHLKQLFSLAEQIGLQPDEQFWVTFDTGLSRSLLADREVAFARYAAPRDVTNIVRNGRAARRLLSDFRFDSAISTGASLAVNYLPIAARQGVPSHYIESAARADGPSLTGRILALDPLIRTYTQYPAWASKRWAYRGSIFDRYEPGPVVVDSTVRTAVVTVGTTESYGFRRLVARLAPILAGRSVLWQTGVTDVAGLPIEGRAAVPASELADAIAKADVIVAHAGTGAALTAFEHGKTPVLVPRRSTYGEHIDDHQIQIAAELSRRGLVVTAEADEIEESHLLEAARRSVVVAAEQPRFALTDDVAEAA